MKIAVICANGKAGKLIVKEGVDRGLEVTAVVRGENKSAAQHAEMKYRVWCGHWGRFFFVKKVIIFK